VTETTTATTLNADLAPGNYTLTVTAFNNGTSEKVAEGSEPVAVAAGAVTPVTVTLIALTTGSGNFSYSVTIPTGLTLQAGSLLLTSLSGGTDVSINVGASLNGSSSVTPGYYRAVLSIEVMGKTAGRTSVLHVLNNRQTIASYDFGLDDFIKITSSVPVITAYKYSESGGNGNNSPNPGETLYLDIRVQNAGLVGLFELEADLSTSRTDLVTIDAGHADIGAIAADYFKTITDTAKSDANLSQLLKTTSGVFRITIDPSCPVVTEIPFSVTFTDLWGDTWTAALKLPVVDNYVVCPAGGSVILVDSQETLAEIRGDIPDPARNNGKNAYILTSDIALTGEWIPIGADPDTAFPGIGAPGATNSAFAGNFYGNGHTISGLRFSEAAVEGYSKFAGLFGYAYHAVIRDLNVEAAAAPVNLINGMNYFGFVAALADNTVLSHIGVSVAENAVLSITGNGSLTYAGGICGYSLNNTGEGTGISDCRSSVSITLNCLSNSGFAGGIAGKSSGIKQSYAVGAISGSKSDTAGSTKELCVGGLTGEEVGLIEQCYATGAASVTLTASAYGRLGGLVGKNSGTIQNSYAAGAVTMNGNHSDGQNAGGLAGTGTGGIEKCYASGTLTGINTDYSNGGGIIGSGGSVDESVALNPGIIGVFYYVGRVGGTATFTKVYAFSGMTVNGSTVTSGTGYNTKNGADMSAANLKLQSTYLTGYTLHWDFTTIWEMGPPSYPYPILKWQNGEAHVPQGFTPITD
jgi:hypothetical protein